MFPPFKVSNDFQTMHSSDIKNSSLDPTASSYFPTAKPISSTETSESFAEFLSPKPSNNPFEKNYFYENPWKSLCNEDENASLYSSGYGSEDRSVQHSPYERLTDEFCSSFSSLIKPLLSYTTQEDSYSPLTSFRFAQKSFAWECDSNEYSNSTQIESGKKFYDEIRQDFDSNGTTTDLDSVFMPSLSSTPLITRRSTFPILKAEQWQTFSSSEPIKESKSQGSSRINTKRSKPNKKSLENHCVFCKNNGASENIYRSHTVKDKKGRVLCPILRQYKCPICGVDGDYSHTVKYCPEKPIITLEDIQQPNYKIL